MKAASHFADRGMGLGLGVALFFLVLTGCTGEAGVEYSSPQADSQANPTAVPDLSETALLGRELFTANCSQCHGVDAVGSSEGPPLVHNIYEPGHHGDLSFHLAVRRGVRQHHWQFGAMDPVPGVAVEEVDKIVCYVRELQYANGIFEDTAGLVACLSG